MRTSRLVSLATALLVSGAATVLAQQAPPAAPPKPASPSGTAATQVGGKYVKTERGQRYEGGKWIEVSYNRPILRSRPNIFGTGAEYGKAVSDGTGIWRVGANETTRFKTEVPLKFGDKTLPAGEYSMFVELKPGAWTLILSNWAAQTKYDPSNKTALWGSSGYTPDKDVVRAPMTVESIPFSLDQLTIGFADVTAAGGKLAIWWDTTQATVPFTVAGS